jgi:hypothetical protein
LKKITKKSLTKIVSLKNMFSNDDIFSGKLNNKKIGEKCLLIVKKLGKIVLCEMLLEKCKPIKMVIICAINFVVLFFLRLVLIVPSKEVILDSYKYCKLLKTFFKITENQTLFSIFKKI